MNGCAESADEDKVNVFQIHKEDFHTLSTDFEKNKKKLKKKKISVIHIHLQNYQVVLIR